MVQGSIAMPLLLLVVVPLLLVVSCYERSDALVIDSDTLVTTSPK